MNWNTYRFDELSAGQLYDFLKLRVDVFVVEQDCPYPELDNLDQASIHLAYSEEDRTLAYARLVPAGVKYGVPSIGRVLVHQEARNRGLAKQLMEHAIDYILNEWQADEIQLQGQVYLQKFYESFGFMPISEPYDEDGIPHIDMKFSKNKR